MAALPAANRMTLYHVPITPSSRKVRMFLHEKGMELALIDVTEGFNLCQWYKDRYPHMMVPMLEFEDGVQLGESVAICRYLEELHPEPRLFGVDARDKAIVEMWERRAYLEGTAAIEEIFRNSHPMMEGRALQGTTECVPQLRALVERGMGRLRRCLDKFEERLTENSFVAGERFSMADITLFCSIDFARAVQIEIPDTYRNLHRWYDLVSLRPSTKV